MKLIYFVTEDWFFCSHFLDRAIAAQKAGFDVSVMTRVNKHADIILAHGFNLIPLGFERTKINPLREIALITKLVSIYKSEQPHIVHHVALKPILYGSLAAKIAGVRAIINAPVGMGYVFSSKQIKARFLRPLVLLAFRFLLNPTKSITVFENPDHIDFLAQKRIVNLARTRLIRGAGVNIQQFTPSHEPEGMPIIILASRMLWDKGIGEFVAAAKILQNKPLKARFVLVGAPDKDNPESIAESQLIAWKNEAAIEWWGHQDDMPMIFRQCHIVCLPSYAEGLPKVLLEAAASSRPIVTTNIPGCREIVRHKENGLLITPKSIDELAKALYLLIENPQLRMQFGNMGREMAVKSFSSELINRQTVALYQEMYA